MRIQISFTHFYLFEQDKAIGKIDFLYVFADTK